MTNACCSEQGTLSSKISFSLATYMLKAFQRASMLLLEVVSNNKDFLGLLQLVLLRELE